MRDRSFNDMDSRRGTTLAAAGPSLGHAAMRLGNQQDALKLVADWFNGMPSTSVARRFQSQDWPRPGAPAARVWTATLSGNPNA
jgi:hypothetical protein